MDCLYGGFDIESFQAGKDLWHARIRRADHKPLIIDGIAFAALDIGFAWNNPEQAIADAKIHIDRFGLRGLGVPDATS